MHSGQTAERAAHLRYATGDLAGTLREWAGTDSPQRFAGRHAGLAALFLVGGLAAAVLMRLELLTPRLDLMHAGTFGALLSFHGAMLFYFVWLPMFPAVLGYAFLPGLLGVTHLAWPRLMLPAWGLLLAGGLVTAAGFMSGGTTAGWTFDAQFGGRFTAVGIVPMAVGVGLAGVAVALIGANLVATIVVARRSPARPGSFPAVVALLCGGASAVAAGIAVAGCALLVGLDHLVDLAIFDPQLGGNPLRYKAVCRVALSLAQSTILLTAVGVVLAVVGRRTAHLDARRHRSLALAFVVMAAAGPAAWPATEATHAAASRFGAQLRFVFFAIAAGAAMSIVLRLVAMLRHGRGAVDTPLLYSLFFLLNAVVLLVLGALLAMPVTGPAFGSTTFATAYFHVLMLTLGMAFLAGLHDAWPRLTRRRCAPGAGTAAAILLWVGTALTFLPMFAIGYAGAPFRAVAYPPAFQVPEVLATAGMTILLVGLVLVAVTFAASRRSPLSRITCGRG